MVDFLLKLEDQRKVFTKNLVMFFLSSTGEFRYFPVSFFQNFLYLGEGVYVCGSYLGETGGNALHQLRQCTLLQ